MCLIQFSKWRETGLLGSINKLFYTKSTQHASCEAGIVWVSKNIYRIIHKFVKHLQISQQINYANRERNSSSIF
jgi:hypothetical protein